MKSSKKNMQAVLYVRPLLQLRIPRTAVHVTRTHCCTYDNCCTTDVTYVHTPTTNRHHQKNYHHLSAAMLLCSRPWGQQWARACCRWSPTPPRRIDRLCCSSCAAGIFFVATTSYHRIYLSSVVTDRSRSNFVCHRCCTDAAQQQKQQQQWDSQDHCRLVSTCVVG